MELKIEFANYLEIFDRKYAFKIYIEIYEKIFLKESKNLVSVELLNNMAYSFVSE